VNRLDALGVQVYDFLGGEPLLHPEIAALIRHTKSKRSGSNLATIITNAFLVTRPVIRELNSASLDAMQVSVDSIVPTSMSPKSLKSVLPKLRLLAEEAEFTVEVQTVLNDETYASYDEFREMVKDLPFAFGFSVMHGPGGRIAIQGKKFLTLLEKYGVFEGVNFYGDHLKEMLVGDFSRPWKCLAGLKFLYVNANGNVQWCAQQREYAYPLEQMSLTELRRNNRHKPCEEGCSLGCVRMVSHTLGEPLKMAGASVRLALSMRQTRKAAPNTQITRPDRG
jgi:MoaA/NifB/PqqE/SkfB family radical SAM enzyme